MSILRRALIGATAIIIAAGGLAGVAQADDDDAAQNWQVQVCSGGQSPYAYIYGKNQKNKWVTSPRFNLTGSRTKCGTLSNWWWHGKIAVFTMPVDSHPRQVETDFGLPQDCDRVSGTLLKCVAL
ncbi:hypothetical protein [Nocardia sp. NPDC049149]|uniref:hypothetical protein n=1 Tax=Nocardia sp. NPDC049149 TaxID=3364315 RepID=UPI00371D7C24